jgi:hypothetical protein
VHSPEQCGERRDAISCDQCLRTVNLLKVVGLNDSRKAEAMLQTLTGVSEADPFVRPLACSLEGLWATVWELLGVGVSAAQCIPVPDRMRTHPTSPVRRRKLASAAAAPQQLVFVADSSKGTTSRAAWG